MKIYRCVERLVLPRMNKRGERVGMLPKEG